MFQTLRNAWKIVDLRKKIFYTLFIILIFRIGSAIGGALCGYRSPRGRDRPRGGNGQGKQHRQLYGFPVHDVGRGGFSDASIFALSITPYINASIIIQLLTVALPPLERMAKDGEAGRKKLGQITRICDGGARPDVGHCLLLHGKE